MRSGEAGEFGRAEPTVFSSAQISAMLLEIGVLLAILTRAALTPTVLNLVINYSTEEGAIYEKIHPGSYLILLLLPVTLLARPIRLFRDELPMVRALIVFTACTILMVLLLIASGRSGSAGYFIDTYVVAGAGGLLLFTLPSPARLRIAGALIALLALSALIGIFEAATHTRVLPYVYDELEFRPTGIADHPLMLGLYSCVAVGFTWAMPWPARLRLALIALFVITTIAAEARFATIMVAATAIVQILLSRWPGFSSRQQRRGKILLLALIAVAAVPVLLVLQAAGFMSRLTGGLVDESTMARIDVYRVFGYVGLGDILTGADASWISRIVKDDLGIEIIESTPVVLIFQLGLPGALAFTALVVFLFRRLCRSVGTPERLSTLAFFVVALSNITLSTKTAAVLIIVTFLVALQRPKDLTLRTA